MALIGSFCRPSMKTLDKKISVSSDQLDTLTTEQRADKFAQVADDDGDDGEGDGGDGDDGDGDDGDGDVVADDDGGDGCGDVQLDTLTTKQRADKFAQIPYHDDDTKYQI